MESVAPAKTLLMVVNFICRRLLSEIVSLEGGREAQRLLPAC